MDEIADGEQVEHVPHVLSDLCRHAHIAEAHPGRSTVVRTGADTRGNADKTRNAELQKHGWSGFRLNGRRR